MGDIWVIPFDGTHYICWGKPNNRQHAILAEEQVNNYFDAEEKEKFLKKLLVNEILN